jgi:hypothetical protein
VILGKNKIAILFMYNFKHWIGKHVADSKFYATIWSFSFIEILSDESQEKREKKFCQMGNVIPNNPVTGASS